MLKIVITKFTKHTWQCVGKYKVHVIQDDICNNM